MELFASVFQPFTFVQGCFSFRPSTFVQAQNNYYGVKIIRGEVQKILGVGVRCRGGGVSRQEGGGSKIFTEILVTLFSKHVF